MNNLRKFNWITQYNSAKEGEELVKPSVSLVIDKAVVMYDDDIHIQYRWINLDPEVDYICDTSTFTKYYKQKKQQSNDGYTWEDVVPAEYRRGDVYQTKSRDCGYMPKLYSTYSDGKEYELLCNSSSKITVNEAKPSGYDYTKMTSAAIGDCVIMLDDSLFADCASLEEIIIPTGITTITQWAFRNCTNLKRCKFDKGSQLTNLGLYTFSGCTSLEEFEIPNGVTEIKYECFENCTSLSSVTIGSGVTRIVRDSFSNCSSLTSINIPNSVTEISDNAFQNCTSLTSVNIGSGATFIDGDAFNGCTSLTGITIKAITPPTTSGFLGPFRNTNNCPIYVPDESVDAYKAADKWKMIASRIKPMSQKPS